MIHRPARSRFQILPDGNPQKVPRMGTLSGLGTPFLLPRSSTTATASATLGERDRRASTAATGRRIVPSKPESLLEGTGLFLAGPVGVRKERRSPRAVAVTGHARRKFTALGCEITRHGEDAGRGFAARRAAAAVASLNR